MSEIWMKLERDKSGRLSDRFLEHIGADVHKPHPVGLRPVERAGRR